jgi:hypothetical protein
MTATPSNPARGCQPDIEAADEIADLKKANEILRALLTNREAEIDALRASPRDADLSGLAEWLKHMQGVNASLAHVPEMAVHIANLKRWETAIRQSSAPSSASISERCAKNEADFYISPDGVGLTDDGFNHDWRQRGAALHAPVQTAPERHALEEILIECDEAPTDNNAWVVAVQRIASAALARSSTATVDDPTSSDYAKEPW